MNDLAAVRAKGPQAAPGTAGAGWLLRTWNGSRLGALLPRTDLDAGILARKVAAVYERLLPAMVLNLLLAVTCSAFFVGPGRGLFAECWLAAVTLLVLARFLDILDYRRDPAAKRPWVLRIQLGAFLQGGLWSLGVLFLLPRTVLWQLVGTLLLTGLAGAVVIFQSPLWTAYCIYVGVLIAPSSIALLLQPEPGLRALGVLGFVYILVMAFASGSASRRLEDLLMAARDNAELEEQRRQDESQREARKMESLGLLAGGIAHDFNNILGAVLGNLNLLQIQTPVGSPSAVQLASMETSVERAVSLTRKMLAFSGGGAFVLQELDLNEVIRQSHSLLKRAISSRASLSLDLGAGPRPIAGDLGQLQQLLMILLTNASEALLGKPGDLWLRTQTVTLDAAQAARAGATLPLQPGEHVMVVVGDTGEGMAPEVAARIFEPFFTTRGSGRGLGLSAVLGILRSHSAGLTLQSRPGAGTTISLYFPVSTRTAPKEPPHARGGGRPFSGRVLLVDDEPTLLETVAAMLSRLGMPVVTARDGIEALECFQADPEGIGLVILDLTMPRMDGHQAFQELRRLRPELPVILSSGYNAQNSEDLLQGPGPSAFLQKPYTIRDLKRVVEATLA